MDNDNELAQKTDADLDADETVTDPDAKPDGSEDDDAAAAAREAEIAQREQSYQTRYRRLIAAAKQDGIDTRALKAKARIVDDLSDDYDDSPRRRTPDDELYQTTFERELAEGRDVSPDAIARKVAQILSPQIRRENQQYLNEIHKVRAVEREMQAASADLAATADEYHLTEEEGLQAMEYARVFGIDTEEVGGPSRYAAAVMERMRTTALEKELKLRTTKAEANAEDRTRTALLARQPDRGAPAKTKPSAQQTILNRMRAAGPTSVRSFLGSEQGKTP